MAEIVLRRATSDGVVSAKPGDTLVVELEENLSTGYSWQIASQTSWCDLIASEHSPATSDLMGASGIHRFRLLIADVGAGAIELSYRRPWESLEAESDHVSIQVDAR